MLTIIGLITIASVVALLVSGRVSPLLVLTLPPLAAAFVAGFGFGEVTDFFESGIGSVVDVAVMFVFAILFFGIMHDVGLFDPLVRTVVRLSRGNIVSICVGTVVIGTITHLDGSGATSLLVTITALLPVYRRLDMSPYLLMTLTASAIGVMNMLPWAGPVGRAAAVLGTSAPELWQPLIPIQGIGLILVVCMAVILGLREKRRITARAAAYAQTSTGEEPTAVGTGDTPDTNTSETDTGPDETDRDLARPRLIWINAALAIAVIAVLMASLLPAGYAFMIGTSLALLINYPSLGNQMERIRAHAPNSLLMAVIILAAGSFLGVLSESGMLDAIATDIVGVLPSGMIGNLHLVLGVVGLPMEFVLSTDATWFAFFPVVEQITAQAGTSATTTAYALAVSNVPGSIISPFAPAVWLGLGLARLEMGKYIRYAFPWMWGLSLVLFGAAIALGVVKL